MNGLRDLIIASGGLVNTVLEYSAALAVLVFIWGLVVFLFKSGNEKSHEEGKNRMLWGVIALFVMTCVWGIVFFIQQDLGLTGVNTHSELCGIGDNPPCDF